MPVITTEDYLNNKAEKLEVRSGIVIINDSFYLDGHMFIF